ncbi:carbohydrate ABC transporter permease [Nonomuraea sp. MG754425]|uniref:carbohydrate ABC transporter permease n=1 Tax=Nonomuraea sp. MG754425 TaxID=2570319 RepID=UPI001F20999B|nr:carbohydrate ABC transporter permease [Nonomuraea sp. MG754425]MCF6472007.1 carbohydrate ABC transporter permease [Nonomuraea sp. MG754425]
MISVGARAATGRKRGRKRSPRPIEVQFRTIVSPHQLNSRWGRRIYWLVLVTVLVVFTLAFVFPLYWMVTGALKTPEELAQMPPTLVPADPSPDAFFEAWDLFDIGTLLVNTAYYSLGGWVVCMAVDVSAAYALSKLRPMFGGLILGMMLATLMIPAMVVLIPLYVTVVDLGLLNNAWALWLPAAANGFNIFLLKRFFDSIPRELIEAAQIDGAGPARILRSVVLPISRPILGVVSIFTIVTSFKDFVWPLLVMTDSDRMTISVGLSQTAGAVTQNQVMGGLLITSIPMIIVFFIFQRHIMAGLTAGSIKG